MRTDAGCDAVAKTKNKNVLFVDDGEWLVMMDVVLMIMIIMCDCD
jgi:hypothetical protein